ncbi:MAG TPA: hypothetical protein VF925_00745 [Casimicrobiaceae bacterium]
MNKLLTRLLALVAIAGMTASTALYASDIDIFGGANGSATPNVLIIVDNTSSNDAAYASSCPFAASPTTSAQPLAPPTDLLGMVYCALYGAVDAIKANPSLLSKLNVALMSGGSGSNKGGQFYIPSASPYNAVLMDAAGIAQFENAIVAGIPKATGNAKIDGDMTEAWAWLTGNTGPRSGISYSAHAGSLPCQKTFIILIGATQMQGRPCNGSGCWATSDLTTAGWTAAQQVAINTAGLGSYTGDDSVSYVDEWARYFYQTNFGSDASVKQNVITYTITAGADPTNPGAAGNPSGGVPDYIQELVSTANQGGGKAFSGVNYNAIVQALLQIFNEVAAVNSVFASSSLPISSNTQGTYQNQVYIGMFRPDANDLPRWLGNLKQYQFGVSGTVANPTLFLADSTGSSAINAATGFITPTAVSFWTSKDVTKLPDSISSTGGFWVNDQQGAGQGFDSPDGEVVEKGGVSQQIRLANLEDNYATNPASPRNMYTCTGTCTSGSALSSTPFATSNASLTQAAFGISAPTSTVTSISRTGNVVTMVLTAAPATPLTNGQAVTVSGAANSELNGTFTITLVNSTTFTYPITESPPTPSTGTYTASIPASPIPVLSLTRSWTGTQWIATATTASNTFVTGQKITTLGASQIEYDGQHTITVTVPGTTFTYPITPGPASSGGAGNATDGGGLNPITITSVALGAIGTTSPFSATATALTGTKPANLPATYSVGNNIIISNVVPGGYDGTFKITAIGSQGNGSNARATISYVINTSPVSPATGTITADPSVSVAVSSITHTTSCTGASPSPSDVVTVNTATTNPFSVGQTISISGTPGKNESAYVGSFLIGTTPTTTSFTLASPITTTPPCAPSASGVTVSTGASSVNLASFVNWVRGDDDVGDEPSPDPGVITVRPSVHGAVVHARPTVVNYGGSIGVVVFYGANDGTFRAVNGNQTSNILDSVTSQNVGPGQEIWSFVAPEFFYDSTKGYSPLVRLYQNSPDVLLATTPSGLNPTPKPKDYFFDGSAGVYQASGNSKVYIYLSARRGGRFLYALDVTDPTNPKLLWRKSSADYAELGYTWSSPKAALLRGYVDGSGNPIPVVIFGGGYDPNEDNEPPTADTMGRGIFILDGTDGHLVWSATFGAGATGTCTGTSCTLTDMTYAIPADITLVNRDFDASGYIDRLYAADLGGNIWRVDLEPAGYTAPVSTIGPSTWTITHFAALGGASADPTKRKFFYPPDIVATKIFDMILGATGDREHPLYSASTTQAYSIVNRFYGLKDPNTGSSVPSGTAIITDNSSDTTNSLVSDLTDATTTSYNISTANNGFYITLLNAGEKAVNAPTTVGGFTYFGTNTPTTPSSLACNNLGTARGYQVNFLTGASASEVFTTGGLPPSPVAGLVNVVVGGVDRLVPFCLGCGNPAGGGPDASSSIGGGRPPIPVPPIRKRVYWYLQNHDN